MKKKKLHKITSGNILNEWASKYPVVEMWLNAKKPREKKLITKKLDAFCLYRFCELAKMPPPALLAYWKIVGNETPLSGLNWNAYSPSVNYTICKAVWAFKNFCVRKGII